MKKKKINFILNIFVILIVLGIVLYFSLKDDYEMIIKTILNMKPFWIVLSLVLFCLYRVLIGISHWNIVRLNKENISVLRSIQINFIILFFHGITPFAGGGGPMEIYYLHNEKIGVTKATNIVLQNFIVYQISLVIVSVIALLYNQVFNLFSSNNLIKKLVIVGFSINILILIVTYLLSFGKKINKFVCNTCLDVLEKTKLVKNVDDLREKLNQYLGNFYKNALELKKHKREVVLNVFLNIFAIILLYTVPYMVIRGLGVVHHSLIEVIISTAFVTTVGSFVPIPGGTGGIEYGYMFFFGYLIRGSVLNASMLVWRFITYYLGMTFGAVALLLYRKKERRCE